MRNTYLWHKELAPEGRIFDLDKTDSKVLNKEGWVDEPAKIGIDAHCGVNEDMASAQAAYESGDIDGIGGKLIIVEVTTADMERKDRELDLVRRNLSEANDEIAMLKKRVTELSRPVAKDSPKADPPAVTKETPKASVPKVTPKVESAPVSKPTVANGGDETSL